MSYFQIAEGAVCVLNPEPGDETASEKSSSSRRESDEKSDRSKAELSSRKPSKPHFEPSKGIYANLIESITNLRLNDSSDDEEPRKRKKTKKDLLASVPPAILVFKKVEGNRGKRVVFKRHVPMLMIRGENIVTISCST